MSTSIVANRIYARERYAAEDFDEMAPDTLLLRACKPPTASAGGIITDARNANDTEVKDHLVRACVAFTVVKLPAVENRTKGNPLNLAPGDVVVARNVLVDPLLGNDLCVTDLYMGVVGVLERARPMPFGEQRGEA